METRRRTWFDDQGLRVRPAATGGDSRPLPFYAGAMHYWRVPPRSWPACLRSLRALGLTLVETYVPWRVHEPTAGTYDWTEANDLRRFLVAAGAAGLGVVLRPGPHVNAELTCFGFPDHVIADEAVQARTSRGTPVWMPAPPRAWPVPSYASRGFHHHVQRWYAEVARVVTPHLAPEGPVVALGVDNEAQMFFRLGAFDHDYHPDALRWWREDQAPGSPSDPPRAWDPNDAARCIAWVRFKDRYLARSLGQFAEILDDVGLGDVARFHNLPPGHFGLVDLRGIQRAIRGPVGIDAYTPRTEFSDLRDRALALAGKASPLPLALEVGIGFFPWFPPLGTAVEDTLRERDHLLTLLAAGVRGFNLFMAVERDRYYGAAITRDGTIEPHAGWIAKLTTALAEIDWPALRRQAVIALVDCKADARFGHATCVLDPMTPVVSEILGLGPSGAAELGTDAGAVAARRWQTAIARALELAHVPFAIIDEESTEDELAAFRAVIVPTGRRIDRALWSRLRSVAEAKRTVCVIGPGTPTHDELDRLLDEPAPRRLGRIRQGSLDDLPGLANDLAGCAGDLSDLWQIERPESVRASAFTDPAGSVRVVFVISDAAKPTTAVLLADAVALRDPFTDERIAVVAGKASIAMHPRGVRMLIAD